MYCFCFLSKTLESNWFIFKCTFYIYVFVQYIFFFLHFAVRQVFLLWWNFLDYIHLSCYGADLGIAPPSHLLSPPKFCSSYLLCPFFFDPCSPFQLPIVLVQAIVTSHKYYFQIICSECVSMFSIYIKGWWWWEE